MRKSIVVLIVAVLAVAAGAVVLSLSAPVLDEDCLLYKSPVLSVVTQLRGSSRRSSLRKTVGTCSV